MAVDWLNVIRLLRNWIEEKALLFFTTLDNNPSAIL